MTPTLRLISVEVSGENGVDGHLRPGDHVDVLPVMKDGRTSEPYSQTVLENVVVRATGNITATTNLNLLPKRDRSYGRISLLVTGEGAELATIVLSLRHPEDSSQLGQHPRTTQESIQKSPGKAPLDRRSSP